MCVFHCSDPSTLYRARTEYQTEFDRFLNTDHTGEKKKTQFVVNNSSNIVKVI